ncbi:hypothetical protein, conserved [Eimeria necatrix]|uniref:Uncharacterized protein n=1 Tax=Eimeria necatrix TaxID=51315 RepID=U6MLP0_9EIME|nr:hypothetical protein, conserved [Eimeria necatrix]CDJ62545.1 hypothetical protein, conserved [Eimeria necatrix]
MDSSNSLQSKLECPGERRNAGLRVVTLVYAALSIYLLTQTAHPAGAGKYPTALSLITATNAFALIGSIFGFLVTLPACMQKTLGSLTVLCFTVSFFLGVASMISVIFSYFSVYWIVFTCVHIFFSMVAVGASYAHFRGLASQEKLEETVPIAASLPQVTESV